VVGRGIIKPAALRRGDTVGIIAPAAAVDCDHLKRGVDTIRAMGFRVKVSEHAVDRAGILAGSDKIRAAELSSFFADPEVKAIFAARGGYGSGRLLPLLDFNAIARAPKILMGFSDATYLLNAILECSRFVTFHGPMVAADFARGLSTRAINHLCRALSGDSPPIDMEAEYALRPGIAEGELIGGCLTVIVATIGTPWQPDFDGRILFLEDTGEKAYRIDRMLTQLRQAGILSRLAGLVFGAIRPVDGSGQERDLIADFLEEQTADLPYPVLSGVEAGHGSENLVLPLGVHARIDAARRRLIFTEPAVIT
jgi:muramoyltetrapeptide carboxypeptidase